MAALNALGGFVPEVLYARLSDLPNFRVRIYEVGQRFKLEYRDSRIDSGGIPARINYTKWFETKGAADEFIRLFPRPAEQPNRAVKGKKLTL